MLMPDCSVAPGRNASEFVLRLEKLDVKLRLHPPF